MASWFGSISFVVFSALFGCLFGFGIAAMWQGFKNKKQEKAQKNISKNDAHNNDLSSKN